MTNSDKCGECGHRRESIWSIPAGWRVAYFSLFSVSNLIATSVIAWYRIANRGDSHSVELMLSIADGVVRAGLALAITTISIMEGVQLPMVLANYIRVKLVEPAKERLRAEGHEAGREQGREQGIEQGRTQANVAWREWNARRMKAESDGAPFHEPPPDVG